MSQQASGMAQDAYGQARDYARDAATVISDTVEQQPIVALLVAGAIGCMIGLLLMRALKIRPLLSCPRKRASTGCAGVTSKAVD